MSKNNDKQRTTHEHCILRTKEKSMNKSRKDHRKANEKPMKNQRRNNEKQWKSQDNFASILSYLLPGIFGPCFSKFSSLMGKEIRDNFEEKRKPVLRCLGSCMFTKPCKYAVNYIFSCICASNGVIFLFAVFWVPS